MKIKTICLLGIIMLSISFHSCKVKEIKKVSIELQIQSIIENNNFAKNKIVLRGVVNNQVMFDVYDLERPLEAVGDILCRGGGVSFARCCGKALDGGLCLLLSGSGGKYTAAEADC